MDLNTALTIALRPITTMLILAFVLAPIRRVFERFMPEGRTKRFLLREIGDQSSPKAR
jgi:hypothetical protein